MFGDYFAQNYPYKYTRKYWTVEPDKLESKWINGRMYTPTLEEILRGAMEKKPHTTHYSKEARYPKYGGFKAFLNPLAQNCNIKYNMNIVEIDTKKKMVKFENGEEWKYSNLISTIPLTELCHMIKDTPYDIIAEVEKLDYTSGVMLSLGLNKHCTSPTLWFYIYDEDILPARVYAPNIKSVNNVPKGCSSIQAEIYYSKYKKIPDDLEKLKEDVITQLLKLGLFKRDDIIVSDIRMKQYANIMFTPQIYSARDIIHNYLRSVDIEYAGRWGEWDYLWVGQSYRSGRAVAERCLKNSKWRK
jgi:protoporphyrinogen oxidase